MDCDGKVIVQKDKWINVKYICDFEVVKIKFILVLEDYLFGCVLVKNVVDGDIGEVIVSVNDEVMESVFEKLCEVGIKDIQMFYMNDLDQGLYILLMLCVDEMIDKMVVCIVIYCMMCLGELLIEEVVEVLFNCLFYSEEVYDLLKVGCMKFNCCVGCDEIVGLMMLQDDDIFVMIKIFVELCNGKGEVDDIDYFGNCCVCCVGELVENQFCVGFVCVECVVKECFGQVESENLMLYDLINLKLILLVICEFFGLLQLLQFMDQINLLLEIMYKCCVFVLGLGGLMCECVGFEVCDVYLIYYGCVCLIEMLEGLNIGLINLFVLYVYLNEYGFFEMLYCKVVDSKVIDQIDYLLVIEEGCYMIVQVNVVIDEDG